MKKTGFSILLLAIACSTVCLAAQVSLEYQIKAGFIYKFLLFAEWPEAASHAPETTITIGILGDDPFGNAFRPIEGQTIDGKTLAIKRFEEGTPCEMLRRCRLLFISPSLQDRIEEILVSLKDHPVLTVSEVSLFVDSGGMINLTTKKDRVSFEVNKAAAERVGIKFRSKLLRVAARVVEE